MKTSGSLSKNHQLTAKRQNISLKRFWLFLAGIPLIIGMIISCEEVEAPVLSYLELETEHNSSESSLHLADDGTLYLSWIETDSTKSKLKFSTLNTDNTWSTPTTITSGSNWFVNWADFPSITSFGDNLTAHYLAKSAEGTYTYDVHLKISNDKGKTWNDAFIPHSDGTQSEHGFVSKVAVNNGEVLNVWLDGRQYAYAEQDSTITKEMTLRGAIINGNNTITKEYLLDARVCDCCQTDTVMTSEGPIVVYRDRSDQEIRDIYYIKMVDNEWSEPKPIYNDYWKINGCPVNGPAIAVKKKTLGVAWFTLKDGMGEIKAAFSNNNGNSFNIPIKLAYKNPLGRVDIEMIDEYTALVSWMDMIGDDTVILTQIVNANGSMSNPYEVSKSSESRSSGFPRMAIKNNFAYMSWTNVGDIIKSIKTAKIDLEQLKEVN